MCETKYESEHIWQGTGQGYIIKRVTGGRYHSMTSYEVCVALARIEALERVRQAYLRCVGAIGEELDDARNELDAALRETEEVET